MVQLFTSWACDHCDGAAAAPSVLIRIPSPLATFRKHPDRYSLKEVTWPQGILYWCRLPRGLVRVGFVDNLGETSAVINKSQPSWTKWVKNKIQMRVPLATIQHLPELADLLFR